MENKELLIKKLIEDFKEKCKELGIKYVIAVDKEIKVHTSSLYLATVIWKILKDIPRPYRQKTLGLLIEYLEEEIEAEIKEE